MIKKIQENHHKLRKKFFDSMMNQENIDGSGMLSFGKFMDFVGAKLTPQDQSSPISLEKSVMEESILCAKLCEMSYMFEFVIPENAGEIIFQNLDEKICNVPLIITYNKDAKKLYVILRGTFCFNDIITDLKAVTATFEGGYMHEGIMKTGLAAFDIGIPTIDNVLKESPDTEIICTGHSLGAGAAGVFCYNLKEKRPLYRSSAIIFAPPPTMSPKLWDPTSDYIRSYHLQDDPVPFCSLHNAAIAAADSLPLIADKLRKNAESDILIPPGVVYRILITEYNPIDAVLTLTDTQKHYTRLPKGLNESHHAMPLYRECLEKIHAHQSTC